MLECRILGGLAVVDGGDELSLGGSRQRRLAAVLLIDRNRVVSVDRLAETSASPPSTRSSPERSAIDDHGSADLGRLGVTGACARCDGLVRPRSSNAFEGASGGLVVFRQGPSTSR
jgi:hypothetical protein